jgi:hypothetical protein
LYSTLYSRGSYAHASLPPVLEFSFDPAEYEFSEGDGEVSLNVSMVIGNLGDSTIIVTTATDDNSTTATATGMLNYVALDSRSARTDCTDCRHDGACECGVHKYTLPLYCARYTFNQNKAKR